MSTTALPGDVSRPTGSEEQMRSPLITTLECVASLKFTVVLFLIGMFIVFVGSLAQARKDVWLVVDQYFRCYLADMDVADLFPPAMFPWAIDYDWTGKLGGLRYISIPGGWTIGWLMLANLLAAHFLRFRIRATGGKLLAGVTTLGIGVLATWLVIWTGNQQTGVESGNTLLTPLQIWYLMLGVMGVSAAIPLTAAFVKQSSSVGERILLGSIGVMLAGVFLYFVIGGEKARLNLSAMRILWQLLKGTACALVMLIGCNLLFEKRGGIVLLHIGVALLMLSELQVGLYADENLLTLSEGERQSFFRDVRNRELAVIARVDGKDQVVAIPEDVLFASLNADDAADARIIRHEGLPFGIRVDRYLVNSALRPRLPNDSVTTRGLGRFVQAEPKDPVTGMDDAHDMPAVELTLVDANGAIVDSLLCAQQVSEMSSEPLAEQVTADNRDFYFYLRFKRNYRDYEVELIDVKSEKYVGSSTPKSFESEIVIHDKEGNTETFTLWMNNPLRYRGETFYQSGYQELPGGSEVTTLSVVRNTGWMLPYIACMIVAVGMFAQFGQTLSRFLARVSRPGSKETVTTNQSRMALPEGIRKPVVQPGTEDSSTLDGPSISQYLVPVLLVAVSIGWLWRSTATPEPEAGAMDLYGFAQIPVTDRGRPQPVDSFARAELLLMSHKSTFKGELTAAELDHPAVRTALLERIELAFENIDMEELEDFHGEYEDWIAKLMSLTASGREAVEANVRDKMIATMPAVRWLLDCIARPELAVRHRVIKIDNDQLLSQLGLEKRPRLTFSLSEILPRLPELEEIHQSGLRKKREELDHRMSQLERRVVELFQRVNRASSPRRIFEVSEDNGLVDSLARTWRTFDVLGKSETVRAIPTGVGEKDRSWETMLASSPLRNVRRSMDQAGVTSREQLETYIRETLPTQLGDRAAVTASVEDNLRYLYAELAKTMDGSDKIATEIKLRAAAGASQVPDPYLGRILEFIGRAPVGADAAEIMAGVTDEDLKQIGPEKISSEIFPIFEQLLEKSDKRLAAMRQRLQSLDEAELNVAINNELISMVLDDIEARAGDVLFAEGEVFDESVDSFAAIMDAWKQGEVSEFNDGVESYLATLKTKDISSLDMESVGFEAFFNFYDPFFKAEYLYLTVLVMSFFSWIVVPRTLASCGFWVMAVAFVVHSAALIARMYISGYPPVTNLYSSAIFIGWAVVGASFFVEWFLKNGIGNVLGSSVGMATLLIAHYLAQDDGSTLGVMQAVLDTTFWLATHVVCITLGYAATFLAGALGMAYCCLAILKKENRKGLEQLGKVTYGVLCFAIFLSLVGTVLGGLWADDSWGRFWGWDPKENGAMLIVMWNAIILHARWDKMIRDYGTAVLAMFGNIVTAWSWFGVNELKAGLHTYGFTEGRLFALGVFMAIQGIIIAGALIPVIGKRANDKLDPV